MAKLKEEKDLVEREVNRFSFHCEKYLGFNQPHIVRYIVTKDEELFYHIHFTRIYTDGSHTGGYDEDIHGKMTAEEYANWLTNALFNQAYTHATEEERKWLL